MKLFKGLTDIEKRLKILSILYYIMMVLIGIAFGIIIFILFILY